MNEKIVCDKGHKNKNGATTSPNNEVTLESTLIQQEITRITNSKTAIRTAINNKGGNISDTALIDTFASAINGLSTGGQSIEGLYYISEDTNTNPNFYKDDNGNLKCTYTVNSLTNDIPIGLYYILDIQSADKLFALVSPNGISVLSKYMGVLYASESDIDFENHTITFNGSLFAGN